VDIPFGSVNLINTLSDLTFILVATPGSALASHGHKLLIIAPIIEGSLGGWSTLQSATSSYVSDCTSSGSRAKIFSRFTGVFYLGFALGPTIGGWIIRKGIPGLDRIGTLYGQVSINDYIVPKYSCANSVYDVHRARALRRFSGWQSAVPSSTSFS